MIWLNSGDKKYGNNYFIILINLISSQSSCLRIKSCCRMWKETKSAAADTRKQRWKVGNATYQRGGENFQLLCTDGHHRWYDQCYRRKKESRRRQVECCLSQIIGWSRSVVVLTWADEIVVDVGIFRHLAQIQSNNSSLKRKSTRNQPAVNDNRINVAKNKPRTRRSQHSHDSCRHCFCDSWPLTFWSQNKHVSRTHCGTFVRQVWWCSGCVGFFVISCGKTNRQTNAGENHTRYTTVGEGSLIKINLFWVTAMATIVSEAERGMASAMLIAASLLNRKWGINCLQNRYLPTDCRQESPLPQRHWRWLRVIGIASIRQVIFYFLLVVCSNNDSILHRFRDIATFTVYLTGRDLEMSFIFEKKISWNYKPCAIHI